MQSHQCILAIDMTIDRAICHASVFAVPSTPQYSGCSNTSPKVGQMAKCAATLLLPLTGVQPNFYWFVKNVSHYGIVPT